MQKLYLMRHGQTVYNTQHILQGRCDSPLTDEGVAQARRTAAWLRSQEADFSCIAASPLGRAQQTLDIVVAEVPGLSTLPRISSAGLMERDYGRFEGEPVERLGVSPWEPGDAAVMRGGETQACARYRIVSTLRGLMDGCTGDALAVSHGSISKLFKTVWERNARCEQDVYLGNCCVLVLNTTVIPARSPTSRSPTPPRKPRRREPERLDAARSARSTGYRRLPWELRQISRPSMSASTSAET